MRILFLALFILLRFSLAAQHTISGVITDANTKTPIADASIYVADQHYGTYSKSDGSFALANVEGRKVILEVSHLGYQTFFASFPVSRDTILAIGLRQSLIPIEEVVITGTRVQAPQETSHNIAQITAPVMFQSGAVNLTDALSSLPGMSQLTTGPGISKPVIRGLYGNRIQVNAGGMRFDNQQWQDEHGLGLSDMGIERVEIIRGPASVLYGSDAIGGVINVMEERPAPLNTTVRDLSAKVHSNTYGLSLNYGIRRADDGKWRNFRIGADTHADYTDGDGGRVLNSRFANYNLKLAWGTKKPNRFHVKTFLASHNLFGFVFDSLARKKTDARLSRRFDGPHHAVSFAQFNSENTFLRGNYKIKANVGFNSNLRLEDEGGGGISLSMLLNTVNGLLQRTTNRENSELTYGGSAFFQSNTNFGGRIIIPDAINGEGSIFTFYQRKSDDWLVEGGVRYDLRFVETFHTGNLNVIGNDSPTEEIFPFRRLLHAFNVSAGGSYFLSPQMSIRGNASTGYRPGNLAELSSNGLHEGTLRWEIGNPDASIEQNLNVEGALNYNSPSLRASFSVYENRFRDFFYLEADGTEYFGFHVYHYRQSDAVLRGYEATVNVNIQGSPVGINAFVSSTTGKKSDGKYLPFIPAAKIYSQLQYRLNSFGNWLDPVLSVGGQYIFDQLRPSEFETSTGSYVLINTSVTATYKKTKIALVVNNFSDESYYDHLSRYKYYGIKNPGRNFSINILRTF
jgi:iron complex outermembrane recepter protein